MKEFIAFLNSSVVKPTVTFVSPKWMKYFGARMYRISECALRRIWVMKEICHLRFLKSAILDKLYSMLLN